MRVRRVRAMAGVVMLAASGVAAGCAATTPSSRSEAASVADESGGVDVAGAVAPPGAEPVSLTAEQLETQAAAADRSIVRSGQVRIETEDLFDAVGRAKVVVDEVGGYVEREETTLGAKAHSQLSLRIPADTFDEAVERIGALGSIAFQGITSDDVTDQLIDVEARITATEQSLARAAGMLDRADNVAELAIFDTEVTKRQTELERLRAQKLVLDQQVSFSALVLTVQSTAEAAPVVEAEQDQPQPGFADGFDAGFAALVSILTAASAALGAALPFLVLLVPLVLVLWGARRLRRGRTAPA